MFSKEQSVEEYVAKECKPLDEEEKKIEEESLPRLFEEKKPGGKKLGKKLHKMLEKKRLEFSFEVKEP